MSKLTILVDMDDIVANFLEEYVDKINAKFDIGLTPEEFIDWNVENLAKAKHLPLEDILQIFRDPMFFWDLKPLDGAIEALDILAAEHDVYFLTAPAGPESAREKLMWVDKHFPMVGAKKTIITHHKHMVKGDVLIDDKATTVERYAETHPHSLVLTIEYPYNAHLKDHSTIITAGKWDDTATAWYRIIREIEKKAKNEPSTTFTDRPRNCC